MLTYIPDDKFLINYKKNKKTAFSGNVKMEVFTDGKTSLMQSKQINPTISMQRVCSTIDVITQINYLPCVSGQHTVENPDGCTVGGPRLQVVRETVTECWIVDIGSGTNFNGITADSSSPVTNPNPPDDYSPCDGGTPILISSTKGFHVSVLPPCDQQPPLPGEPTPVTSPIYLPWDIGEPEVYSTDPNFSAKIYILDAETRRKYPRFSGLINNMNLFLSQNPEVLQSLIVWSGFSKEKIFEICIPGKGPKISLVENSTTTIAEGYYDPKNAAHEIFLSKSIIDNFEQNKPWTNNYNRIQAVAFFITALTLHETVHYGRFINNLPEEPPGSSTDNGFKFAQQAFGFRVGYGASMYYVNYEMYLKP